MRNRLGLHTLLLSTGCPNVYYQVPTNMNMQYPCIRYTLNSIKNRHANNTVYQQDTSYSITVMSKDPDDKFICEISKLPRCGFDRRYIQDNIYHTVFTIYY